jgi:hypothetical protein
VSLILLVVTSLSSFGIWQFVKIPKAFFTSVPSENIQVPCFVFFMQIPIFHIQSNLW